MLAKIQQKYSFNYMRVIVWDHNFATIFIVDDFDLYDTLDDTYNEIASQLTHQQGVLP